MVSPMIQPFRFLEPLKRGVIRSRPNRFVMMVECANTGRLERCHCPVTGNIGYLDFNRGGVSCLLSPAMSPRATTAFTVEAISLDAEHTCSPAWIGINQNKANRYFEYFLSQGVWPELTPHPAFTLSPEVSVGGSRIDFCIDRYTDAPHYIEVKTPLIALETSGHPNFDAGKKDRTVISDGRLTRHMDTLSAILDGSPGAWVAGSPRCSMVLLFMYDAPRFNPPRNVGDTSTVPVARARGLAKIFDSVDNMNEKGVRRFQLNLKITEGTVSVIDFFSLE